MNQKILTVLLIFFTFLAAFLGGYLLSGNGLPKEANNSNYQTGNILDKFDNQASASENISSSESPSILSKNKVASFTLLNTGDISYYEKGTGRMFSVNSDTKEEKVLSANALPNFIKTIWSSDKQEVISQFYSLSGTQYKYYNFQTKQSATLNSLQLPAFSPDGSQIVSFASSLDANGTYNILISQPNGSISKKIFSTRLSYVNLYWPQDNLLAFEVSDNRGHSKLFSLTKEGEVGEILTDAQNLKTQWSPDGQLLLFSKVGDTSQTELSYQNIMDGSETLLPVTTSASKCAWSIDGKTIVCAVPTASGDGEELYKVDVTNKTKQLITALGPNMQVQEMLLSNIDNYAIFLNSYDERIYSVKIGY